MIRAIRQRKCKTCRNRFTPRNSLQVVCGLKCAAEHGKKDLVRQQRREKTEGRKRLMTRSDWMKRAQTAVNAYVRQRDANLPCVSCGRYHAGQWHAGHYRTTKACPELRLNPLNIHKQCAPCNEHLSGNLIPYRRELIRRIGLELVEWIEGPHAPAKYTISDLQMIEANYKAKLKELKQREAA